MKYLVPVRHIILIIGIAVTVITAVILMFGVPEEKLTTVVLTLVTIFLMQAFCRFWCYNVKTYGTKQLFFVFSWVFMLLGLLLICAGIIGFFFPFPSSTVPFTAVGFTVIVYILQEHTDVK